MPKVSICLPNLNNRPFLEERLQSIYDQTFEDWELIIVDNYSDDGAWELFQEHAKREPRIKLSQAPKAGMYANWNNTLSLAEGDYFYVATSDDTMYPRCLEEAVAGLERHPAQQVVMFGIDVIDAHGRKLEYWHSSWKRPPVYTWGDALKKEGVLPGKKEFLSQIFACGAYQSITGMLFSRRAWEETGDFPNEFGAAGDTIWVMELMRKHDFVWLPDSLATWRLHESQASRPTRLDHSMKSDRARAVDAALDKAENTGFLSSGQLECIRDYRTVQVRAKTAIRRAVEKAVRGVTKINQVYKHRSNWVRNLWAMGHSDG